MTKYLAAVALAPILAGPALANSPCVSCRKVVKKVVAPPAIVKVVKEVAATVTVFQPVYLSQVVPAPAYTVNLTVPPPPPAPVLQTYIAPPSIGVYGQTTTTVQGGAAAVGQYQGQQYQQPPQQLSLADQRLDRLEAALSQVCETLKIRADVKAPLSTGIPRSVGRCATCHSTTISKGDFRMFDRGSLMPLTAKDHDRIERYIRAKRCPPQGNAEQVPPLSAEDEAEVLGWNAEMKKQAK